MPYTRVWDETQPPGTALANTLDTIIQNFKTDVAERLEGIFGLSTVQFAADPIVPRTLTLSVGYTGPVLTPAQPLITSLGVLTNLAITSTAGKEIILGGSPTDGMAIQIGNSTVFGGLGSTFSGGWEYLSHNALPTAKLVDNWAQSNAALASSLITVQPTGIFFYNAVIGKTAGTFAAFWGAAVASITTAGFVGALTGNVTGNLTGTILTAAQPNITSVGTLVGLIINASGNAFDITLVPNTTTFLTVSINANANRAIFGADSSGVGFVGTLTNNSFTIRTNNTARVTIDNTGIFSFATAGGFIQNVGVTTSQKFIRLTNTGGDALWGIESNAGGTLFLNTSGYSTALGTVAATSLHLATNNTSRFTIDSAGVITFIGAAVASAAFNMQQDSAISSAKKFFLDGGGDTYIWESSANVIQLVRGGSVTGTIDAGGISTSGIFSTAVANNQFGSAVGATGAKASQNILLYNVSANNWAGIQSNVNGDIVFSTGLATRFSFVHDVNGQTILPGNLNFSNFVGSVKIIAGTTGFLMRDSADAVSIIAGASNGDVTIGRVLTVTGTGGSAIALNLSSSGTYAINGTQVVGPRLTGWAASTATLSRTAIANADTLAQTISHLAALKEDLTTSGLVGP